MGAMVVQLVESWVCNPEDTGSESRAGGKKNRKQVLQPTNLPICNTSTWSCTGEQSTLAVSHCPLMVVVGLLVPTPAVGGIVGTSCEPLAPLRECS